MKNKINTRSLVITSLFIAIALCVRTFSINIVAAGTMTMRISFSAVFYVLPGLLFGPLYGGIAGGLVDILGYMIAPVGAYIPFMTITNILAGILPAVIWNFIKNIDENKIKKYYVIFFTLVFLIGVANFITMKFLASSNFGKLLLKLGKKAQYLGVGFIIIAGIGFAILVISLIVSKKNGGTYNYISNRYCKFVICLGGSGIVVSTLNTCILLMFTPSLMTKGFMIFWIPRIFETLFVTLVDSYLITILMYYYELFEKRIIQKA